jgi:hypothetical protein
MVAPHARIYRNTKTGELHIRQSANVDVDFGVAISVVPVGAMWFVAGFGLVVRTPGGDWTVDQEMPGGGRWTRSGVPPKITVEPDVRIGNYHGRLRDGFLEECC